MTNKMGIKLILIKNQTFRKMKMNMNININQQVKI